MVYRKLAVDAPGREVLATNLEGVPRQAESPGRDFQALVYADLFMGNAALTYSERGYGYAMEKAGSTKGWSFTVFEEAFNQGYPQELKHFIQCVREDREPVVTGEDGRAAAQTRLLESHGPRRHPQPPPAGPDRGTREEGARGRGSADR